MLGGQQQHGDPIHLNAHPPPINAGRGAHSGGFWSSRFMQTVRLNLKWVMILGILLLVAYALFTPSKSTNTIADAVSSASGSSSSTRGATMSPTHPGKLQPPLGSKPVLAASGSSNHSPRPKSNGKKNGNTNKQDATKQSPSSASKLIAASTSPPVFAGLSPNIPKRAPPQPRCSDVCLATDYTGSRFRECLRQACMPRDVLTRKPLSYAAARSMLYTFVNNPAALALSEPTPYAPKDAPVAATGSNPAASNSNNNNNNNDEPAAGAAVAAGLYAGSSAASTADAANADVTATAVTDSIVGGGGGSGGHLTCVYGGYTIPYPALQENVALELLKQLQPEKRRRRSKRDRDGGRRGNRQSRRGRRRHKSDTASSSSADADDVYRAVEETKESPSSSSMMQVQMPDPINCEHTLPQSAFRWPCQRPRSPAAATSTGEEGMDEVKENTMANDDSNVNSNSLRRRGRGRGRGGRHGRGHDRGRGRGRGGRCRRGKVERRLQSDLHHMFPAHAELNRERGNLPFGELDEVKLLQKERQQLAAREKEREEEEQEERRRNSNTRRRQRRGHGRGRRRDYIDEYDMEIMEAEKDKKNPAARAATAASVTSSVTPGDGTVTDSTSSTSSLATCPVDLRWYRESEEQEPPPDSKTWGVYSKRDGNVGTWEPPEQHKGAVVRSLAYMYTMYENELMAVARYVEKK